jgi:hypothetical protein
MPLQSRGVAGGGEGVVGGSPRVPSGSQRVSSVLRQHPACFCMDMRAVFGVGVYRNSTGGSLAGKSAGKGDGSFNCWHVTGVHPVGLRRNDLR